MKRGIFTSEFYVTIGGLLVSFLTAISSVPDLEQFPELKAIIIAATTFVTAAYGIGRSLIKASAVKAGFQG